MPPYEITPSGSPVRKKPRLSSPENTPSSQECINDTDQALNLRFSKSTPTISTGRPGQPAQPPDPEADPHNPFASAHSHFSPPKFGQVSSALSSRGFASASAMKLSQKRSPSPEVPIEQDFETWFKPSAEPPAIGFQAASLTPSSMTSGAPGFVSLGSKAILAPSAAALAKAQERMKEIWDSDAAESENVEPSPQRHTEPTFQRPALQPLENGFQSPSTPSPSGASRHPLLPEKRTTVDQLKQDGRSFRSPLLRGSVVAGFASSPLNPSRGFASASSVSTQRQLTPMTPSTPVRSTVPAHEASDFRTPVRTSASSISRRPAPFVTPFKPGMRPGEPGWAKLQESTRKGEFQSNARGSASQPYQIKPSPQTRSGHRILFDLSHPVDRKTLATSGLRPQQFTRVDFESMNINIQELQQITPALAMYYSFHTTSTPPRSQTTQPAQLSGPTAALRELHDYGCTLATKQWVDNHWGLIFWKLAAMVALDPDSEADPLTRRWCWAEVKRQLLYRYERELNQAKRPALRLISTQDAPAAFPMALCVSDILWIMPEGCQREAYPELEVTDGWYRLKAKIDAPMARAVRRGIIRVGRKIGVAGAKLDSERKEPQEVLEAYNSVKLVFSGNSSHLLPWDAKLGFMRGPCISTMHSLSHDGGFVAAMDVVVVKESQTIDDSYPVAFLEFLVDQRGRRRTEGPRNEAEEKKLNEEWKKKREHEASKIRIDFDKKMARYESYIDKLERRAGTGFQPNQDDELPDHIEKLHDQLEEHDDAIALLNGISQRNAGWLARYTRDSMQVERERIADEIEKELEASCPPRDLRNFRILVVQDSQTCRRPAYRHAQLTVWDVLSLTLSEGTKAGTIEIGSRLLITNLIPTQQSAWMDNKPDAQIFLATTRSTRWRKLKSH